MKYKKTFFVVTLAAVILASSAWAKSTVLESRWIGTLPKIDANPEEWKTMTMAKNSSLDIDYAFANDGKNLYLLFIFKDPRYLSTFTKTGLTLWLNMEGKKKKTLGVKMQSKSVPPAMMIAALEQERGAPLPETEKLKLLQAPFLILKQCYLEEEKQHPIPLNNALNPDFACIATPPPERHVVFECRIPLEIAKAVPATANQPPLEIGKEIMVGFEWGGMTDTMRGEDLRRGTVRTESKRAGETTGDLTREYGERTPDSLIDEEGGGIRGPKKYSFWSKLKLATQG